MSTLILRIFSLICFALPLSQLQSREQRIIFHQQTPPYVLENGNGIVVDSVREALKASGHTLVPVYVPIWARLRVVR